MGFINKHFCIDNLCSSKIMLANRSRFGVDAYTSERPFIGSVFTPTYRSFPLLEYHNILKSQFIVSQIFLLSR